MFQLYKKDLKELLKSSIKEKRSMQKFFEQLDTFITCHKNRLNSNIAHLRLKVVSIEINELLAKVATSLKPLELEEKVQVHVNTKHKSICCDSDQVIQLLVSGLNDLQKASTDLLFTLSLQETTLCYSLDLLTKQNYKK